MSKTNKIFLVASLALFLTCAMVSAQVVIEDPHGAALQTQTNVMLGELTAVNSTMKDLEEAAEKARSNTSWLKDLKTVDRLRRLIENSICGLSGLSARIDKRSHGSNSCLFKFRFDIAMVKLNGSAENLMLLLSSLGMERSARLELLSTAIKQFEEAQNDIASLNLELKVLEDDELARAEQKSMYLMSPYKKNQAK